ncbi:DHA2 family efflux MFS transporter permease subunit [Thermomonospora cellulosilytica]|uniref:EmrB/QacA subfamily drug resistance transporter n=1 Tax=Thermomonospora cellulosilytica TaxID=1411118 RepID=A0A7W3R9L1_9ACTN|nr:DHA2 family efflux MFS transporter permease subunit [Thermomonospora cellulosilytica]MBA9004877.1 EmrB/QacA subfamily drug resistance transporter [Thermomonospora cellulosilytica]
MKSSAPPEVAASTGGGEPASDRLDRAVWATAAVVVLGAVMSILDVTVVNIAIPALVQEFESPLSQIQWVATGYTLALATVIPVTGWACARFGTKRLFMISLVLFVAGSALAGAAWSAESLIAFRVLQGLGGGMIMPAGMTIMAQKAGPQRVGKVMSVVGIPMLLGPIGGPILGGWLVDDVSWRWIFYINVPIGVVTLIMAWKILDRDVPQPAERLDLLGLLLLSPGLAALIYGLATGAEKSSFSSTTVLVTTIGGALLVAGFAVRATMAANPLIDLRLFKRRSVLTASLTLTTFGVAFFGAMLLLPLYFQSVQMETALGTGLLLIPQGVGAMITMPIGGLLTDRMGPGRVVLVGLPIIVVSMFGLTFIEADTSYVQLGAIFFVLGLGMGLTMMPTMSAAMQSLGHDEVPRASTALNIIQQVAGSIGTAAFSVILTNEMKDRIPGAGGAFGGEGAQNLPPEALAKLPPLMAESYAATFWWAVILLAVAVLPALFLPRTRPETGAAQPTVPMH